MNYTHEGKREKAIGKKKEFGDVISISQNSIYLVSAINECFNL